MKAPTLSVFIDSSVLIAAAISSSGAGRELIIRGFRGQIRLFISDFVMAETERNLARKAPAALPAFQTFRDILIANVANPTIEQVGDIAKVVEPKDAPIVAAALQARADFLATYDRRHLLSQRDTIDARFQIAVVTPDEVLRRLRA